MKEWSLPRLALILWFAFYALLGFTHDLTVGRPNIFWMILEATIGMGLSMLFVGFLREE